jgi:hypothetical protein
MVKSSRQGTSFEIATQGVLTPRGLSVVTHGLIEPIFVVEGTGGVVVSGAAEFDYIYAPVGTSGVVVSGGAEFDYIYAPVVTGGVVVSGAAEFDYIYAPVVTGDIIVSGAANISSKIKFGRGGAKIAKRIRQPTTKWTPSEYDPDKHLAPVDYRKKIEDVLAQAALDKLNIVKHVSNGTTKIAGRAYVVAIYRDLPDSDMIVANCPPATPIVLDLPHVFNTGATAREIAELEDHLILNDLFGLGDYTIKKGPKSRYVHQSRKTTSGTARVKFGNADGVKFVSLQEKLQRREDDEFMLEVNMRTQQDREEEELRMLGIID